MMSLGLWLRMCAMALEYRLVAAKTLKAIRLTIGRGWGNFAIYGSEHTGERH